MNKKVGKKIETFSAMVADYNNKIESEKQSYQSEIGKLSSEIDKIKEKLAAKTANVCKGGSANRCTSLNGETGQQGSTLAPMGNRSEKEKHGRNETCNSSIDGNSNGAHEHESCSMCVTDCNENANSKFQFT